MRIISLNLNGIRSAANKGFFTWMLAQQADIICVQELKAQAADMTMDMLAPRGYHGCFHYAANKGYSGVGIYTKRKPDAVIEGLGIPEFDAEGRYIEVQFGNLGTSDKAGETDVVQGVRRTATETYLAGRRPSEHRTTQQYAVAAALSEVPLSVVSVYLPSGSSGEERQTVKFKFMAAFMPHLIALRNSSREIILCGDWNIAHQEIDLKNWRGNQKNSGFLPEERAWLTQVFDEVGFVDVFRKLHPGLEAYTWWSNRGQAWAKNVGWRIDYHIATPGIAQTAQSANIYKERRFSDHAPLMVDYDYAL